MNDMQNQVAIVTGGAMGIGGATARRLAEIGVRVLIADVNMDTAEENADRIRQAGGTADTVKADVTLREDIEGMIAQAVKLWGRLDILVNNAWGRKGNEGSAVTLTEESWDYAMNILIKSMFLSVKYAVPEMEKTGGGAIVNISSVHGLLTAPGMLSYDTGKAAVIGLTRQMAVDFGPIGIRVNAICPGHIATEGIQKHWAKNPARLRFFEAQYPVRRVGKPEDIANAIRFLCSDEASFITGHTLVVDGGLTIQLQENFGVNLARFYREHPETEL